MLAIIQNEDKTIYTTNVLAVKYDYGYSQVIAFNKNFTKIVRLDMYNPVRTVYMLDEDGIDFSTEDWYGLDWVVNDEKLMSKLEKGGVDINEYPQAKQYAHKIDLPEWFEVKTDEEVKNLNAVSMRFHDAYITNAVIDGNNMELELDKTFEAKFTVKFIDVIDTNIVGKVGLILHSKMTMEDGIICWRIEEYYKGWVNKIKRRRPKKVRYIKCKRILWKMEPSNK